MSTLHIASVQAKYSLIQTMRIPIALIGSLVFPALALLFFVVPNASVAQNPQYATWAVIAMAVFATMSNSLFSFALTISEGRAKPWEPYMRTLPAPPAARILSEIMSTGLIGVIALIPVVVVGAIFTAAEAPIPNILLGLVGVFISGLPFMFMGIAMGYALSMKAAIAVVQIVMFAMAFLGGLFLPPQMFPSWLDTLSKFTPARQAREFVVWVVQGGELAQWAWIGLIVWTVTMFVLAVWLYRRDEGRRFK